MNGILRKGAVPLLLSCAAWGCASGGASSPGAAASPGTAPSTSPKSLVLVEASGPGPELERFMPRFLSELSDRGIGNVVDARLAGAKLDRLEGSSAEDFRRQFPGDAWMGVQMDLCVTREHQSSIPADYRDPTTGVLVHGTQIVTSFSSECPVKVTVLRAADRRPVASVDVKGLKTGSSVAPEDEDTGLAAEDAAVRAAKKLATALR